MSLRLGHGDTAPGSGPHLPITVPEQERKILLGTSVAAANGRGLTRALGPRSYSGARQGSGCSGQGLDATSRRKVPRDDSNKSTAVTPWAPESANADELLHVGHSDFPAISAKSGLLKCHCNVACLAPKER